MQTAEARLSRAEARTKGFALRAYDLVVDSVIIGLILLMLVVLVIAFVAVVMSTARMFQFVMPSEVEANEFRLLVEAVLEVFIIIELFDTFVEYVRTRHVKLSILLDVTVVFILREILVKLYAQKFAIQDLIGLCVLALLMVIARSITARFPVGRGRSAGARADPASQPDRAFPSRLGEP